MHAMCAMRNDACDACELAIHVMYAMNGLDVCSIFWFIAIDKRYWMVMRARLQSFSIEDQVAYNVKHNLHTTEIRPKHNQNVTEILSKYVRCIAEM